MRPQNPKTLAALAGAAVAAVFAVAVRPAARADHRPATWEPAEAAAWADPGEAERTEDLDARGRQALARIAQRAELVESLVRGERTLADAAAGFRALNADNPCPYPDLADRHPAAGEDELACRQVVACVRRRAGADPARYAAALARLEAEVDRRFPPAAGG